MSERWRLDPSHRDAVNAYLAAEFPGADVTLLSPPNDLTQRWRISDRTGEGYVNLGRALLDDIGTAEQLMLHLRALGTSSRLRKVWQDGAVTISGLDQIWEDRPNGKRGA
jgi:hypothetical protein